MYALGKGRYSTPTIVLALFLFAFYAGTNRNIAAGEPDDNIAALFFSLGVLVYLSTARTFLSSLIMGVGFLFKFWVAIFCAGFGLYLLLKKPLRDHWLAALGMGAPFLLINFVDGFESMRALWVSSELQRGYSTWESVGFKMLSTGMLVSVLISGWTWLKQRNDHNTLFFLLSSSYGIYVLVNRDAWAVSFVMMQCIIFSSFLIAECVLYVTHWSDRLRNPVIIVLCTIYLMVTSVITHRHLYRDTIPISFVRDQSEAERMFCFNTPSPDKGLIGCVSKPKSH